MIFPFAYSAKLIECGSKHLALYLAIREAITEGKLSPGERLPSTRRLAALYDLSRGSVSVAYEMLTAEGFVQAGVGQGTFVAGWEHEAETTKATATEATATEASAVAPSLTKWGRRLMKLRPFEIPHSPEPAVQLTEMAELLSFVPEGVGKAWFPWSEWKAEVAMQWKKLGASQEGDPLATEGSWQLRQAIAGRLRRERGIGCEPCDIVITAGSMQAIALIAQLLLEEGKTAVVENPSYTGIQLAVSATGARMLAQDVDRNGIVPQDWKADLLFVTPTRQFPTGVVLSYERRRALLAWASRHDAWIVEDDYDSDFRWGGRPIEPLKSLDKEGRVIYVGTFSRSMGKGVRIGYAVLPKELIHPFISAKNLYDPYPTGIAEQQSLAKWMSEGGYDRHMRRVRRIFGRLESKLRLGLERELSELFDIVPSDAGLHVYAKWKKSAEAYELLVRQCALRSVTWKDGARYIVRDADEEANKPVVRTALFGFAHLDESLIDIGINRIRRAANELGLIGSDEGQGGNVHA
ncbi:PLP-dependent aminotransferase family protein [Cohnella lupini]|uniref:GntR family transcriptional regulator/MocR family aminotransferase n=1 Tax=Cohnella lupini TaxID=1294267 RepID=A0A3D9I5P3_9BACL|nr:PLP-dependent aminotransferase family protein [Cohnella lupini]RED57102.1 GntR family transcriptional regulator/MocR family aminotransferase [Cohnella lupini]